MTHAEFQILKNSERLREYWNTKDDDVVRYCISRSFSIPFDKVKSEIVIKPNFVRHELTIETNSSYVIKILSTLPSLNLSQLSQGNNYIKFDMDRFFNRML